MHVKSQSAFTYSQMAKSCIDECAAFAAEIDLDLASSFDPEQLFKMRENGSLHDFFSATQLQKIRNVLIKAFEVDIEKFINHVPLFTVNAISEKLMSKGNPLPLDLSLWMYAKTKQKYCFGIEDFEAHYEVLHSIPYAVQAKQLHKLSKNVSSVRKEVAKLNLLYSKADIKNIYKKAKQSLGSMRDIMLYERNDIMSRHIMDFKNQGKLFCAVGAAHLYGKNGILAQLKRSGYQVKPIFQEELSQTLD